MRMNQSLLYFGVLMAVSGAAIAQAPPAPTTPPAQTAPPQPQRGENCTPMRPANPNAAPDTTTGQRSEPLGERLSRSDGVLCPPAGVDPEMRAPAPNGGNTPVIPPPGSPGGDPSVRPK
ncbi:hypothetical protein [Bradyrhizobium cenepequi]|jgi:hypothetical protein